MKIGERKEGSVVIVTPVGRMDTVRAPLLESRIGAIVRRGDHRIVLDCAQMTYISSAGLRVLVFGAKACHREGGELSIASVRSECRPVLDASGLLSFIDCHETVPAALAAADHAQEDGIPAGRSRLKAGNGQKMEIGELRNGEAVILTLDGHLNSVTAPSLEARAASLIRQGGIRIVLDCSRLVYVNSTGLRALLICAKSCQLEGGKLVIASLQAHCRQVMGMSGFLSIIDCHETVESALDGLSRTGGELRDG
ncbi:MAG: STAS domain-containing protein [Gammaproteobacteria bacterium]|nr:STAS domain-containing protein [Gammaproteobacteria bacterium]MYG67012.1 STAS domain-containing protein [Gammaproteobacteria bacterium]